ncbi:conserved hypothetical protein [uncultured Desulfobacterium sp.]|uniref:Methyltransferase type 11 domain-containing protein n=1 Tax=uncultured Desulfobacterium sp. TaxID=201089 RepID=A0A445N1D6_9BACT|nr:conserved hypothetical protein [uncultured Desulfobacterium sp.]
MKINDQMTLYTIPSELGSITGDTLRPGGLAITERAADFCGFSINDKIIDIGCGFGTTLKFLHKKYGCSVCGIDLRVPKSSGEFPFVQSSAEDLSFADNRLSGVFCECVLSLLSYPDKAAHEFYRVLRKTGFLVISDIYLRNPGVFRGLKHKHDSGACEVLASIRKDGEGISSCLSGAMSREQVSDLVQRAGFDVLLWEDHSESLAQLAANIVWELGSLDMLISIMLPGDCSDGHGQAVRNARPGYFLMIACKKSTTIG